MKYGEIVTFSDAGFQMSSDMLYPISIHSGDRCCWGAFIENYSEKDKTTLSDIILSPIPHNSWACTLHLQARILLKTSGFISFLDIINNNEMNIISFDFTHGGHTHNIILIITLLGELIISKDYNSFNLAF